MHKKKRTMHNEAAFCLTAAICLMLVLALGISARGQEPSPRSVAAAMERLTIEAIDRAEKSVVAITRVRKDDGVGEPPLIDGFPTADQLAQRAEPTDPRFVPTEFGTGVVIDATGLVLTNYHVLGNIRQADFFIWHGRKPYKAAVKAADPWLDLAILKFEDSNL